MDLTRRVGGFRFFQEKNAKKLLPSAATPRSPFPIFILSFHTTTTPCRRCLSAKYYYISCISVCIFEIHRFIFWLLSFLLMSSNTSSSLQGTGNDLGGREALIIGAASMAMMIFLIMLRLACNSCIDLFLLGGMRNVAEAFRTLFPAWHVRTNPEQATQSRTTTGAASTSSSRIALDTKILTKTDLLEHKARYCSHRNNNNNNGNVSEEIVESSIASYSIMCSICLQELFDGDHVFVGDCNHIFHKDCMLQWVVQSQGRDCPNCRCEIVPRQSAVMVDMGDAPPAASPH